MNYTKWVGHLNIAIYYIESIEEYDLINKLRVFFPINKGFHSKQIVFSSVHPATIDTTNLNYVTLSVDSIS